MGNESLTPTRSGYSRVFLIEGRARADHKPSYESCFRMMGASQGFGDVEAIENPDPNQYGNFVEIGQTQGATERPTTSLEGRLALDLKSDLLRLARKRCAIDLQLHLGACKDPRDFNAFDKIMVFEQAFLTNYSTDELGALTSGDNSPVNESVDVSAKSMYDVVPVSLGVKAGDIVTNELVDVVICDAVSCGECEDESDGCYKVFALSKSAGGSPSTPSDVVFSLDKGVTWAAHDVDTLGAAEDADGIDCVGSYIVVVSNASASLHYALKSEFGTTDPSFTEVTTGFVASGEPNAIFSIGGMAFIAGDGGHVYKLEDPADGVTALESGTLTSSVIRDVHAISQDFAVAVGDNGVVMYTENGSTWSLTGASPVGHGVTVNCVFVKDENEWWVGCSDGSAYYSLDKGDTWTEKAFTGSGAGEVYDIEFSTDSVGWIAHKTSATKGRILRTYNGGYSWIRTPESGASAPACDQLNALAVCSLDPNYVVGVGLADDASDGHIVIGQG